MLNQVYKLNTKNLILVKVENPFSKEEPNGIPCGFAISLDDMQAYADSRGWLTIEHDGDFHYNEKKETGEVNYYKVVESMELAF